MNFQQEIRFTLQNMQQQISQLQEITGQLERLTDLVPFNSVNCPIRTDDERLFCGRLMFNKFDITKLCLHNHFAKLFRYLVTKNFTDDQLTKFGASNHPQELDFLIDATLTIWNHHQTDMDMSRKVTCSAKEKRRLELLTTFGRICSNAR